jgi:hypothetical protein
MIKNIVLKFKVERGLKILNNSVNASLLRKQQERKIATETQKKKDG